MPYPEMNLPVSQPDWLRDLPQAPPSVLADEIALLRKEIAALRQDLLPGPSTILHGPEAVAFFRRLESRLNHKEPT